MQPGDGRERCHALAHALSEYVSGHVRTRGGHEPASAIVWLTQPDTLEAARLADILESCTHGEFGPIAPTPAEQHELLTEARQVLEAFEKSARPHAENTTS